MAVFGKGEGSAIAPPFFFYKKFCKKKKGLTIRTKLISVKDWLVLIIQDAEFVLNSSRYCFRFF